MIGPISPWITAEGDRKRRRVDQAARILELEATLTTLLPHLKRWGHPLALEEHEELERAIAVAEATLRGETTDAPE